MKCNQCGTEFEGKFCPECGAKNEVETPVTPPPIQEQAQQQVYQQPISTEAKPKKKKKPFFLRWWFIVLAIIVVGIIALSAGGGEKSENYSGTWKVDHIGYNGSDFTVDEFKSLGKDTSGIYMILNDNGKGYFYLDDNNNEYFEWNLEDNSINVGNDSLSVCDEMLCLESDGFQFYFKKTSTNQVLPKINGDESSGIDESSDNTSSETLESTESSSQAESSKVTESSSTVSESNLVNGMHKDFKEAMDSYENFMDEYVAFMKKYSANPTDLGLLADYANYMSKYSDMVSKFEKWESEDLNDAELAYYIDVQTRVSKKLLEVAQ